MATIDVWAEPASSIYTGTGESRARDMLYGAPMQAYRFDLTVAAQQSAVVTVGLVRIKAGIVAIWPSLSWIAVSALGASRTMDLGHNGYTERGQSATSAAPTLWQTNTDVSGSTSAVFNAGAPLMLDLETSVDIVATIDGGTLDVDETFTGFVVATRYF